MMPIWVMPHELGQHGDALGAAAVTL